MKPSALFILLAATAVSAEEDDSTCVAGHTTTFSVTATRASTATLYLRSDTALNAANSSPGGATENIPQSTAVAPLAASFSSRLQSVASLLSASGFSTAVPTQSLGTAASVSSGSKGSETFSAPVQVGSTTGGVSGAPSASDLLTTMNGAATQSLSTAAAASSETGGSETISAPVPVGSTTQVTTGASTASTSATMAVFTGAAMESGNPIGASLLAALGAYLFATF